MSFDLEKVLKFTFWVLAFFLLFFLVYISRDFGITFDEWAMSNGGVLVLRFLFSGGQDKEILTFLGTCGQHPQFFNSLVGMIYGLISGSLPTFIREGLHVEKNLLPYFQLSHQVNAFFGFLAIFFAGRAAKEIAGVRAGIIVLLLMACSPRFVGDMMNNSKDIPFAGPYMMALFYMLHFFKEMPAPKIKTVLLLAGSIAAAIGVRVGGFLLFCYLLFFMPLFALLVDRKKWSLGTVFLTIANLGVIIVLAYAGGLIFWPKAIMNPFTYPIESLLHMSNFVEWDGVNLFDGRLTRASDLPGYYLVKSIAISVPLVVLAGWILFALTLLRPLQKPKMFAIFFLLFSGLFPLGYIYLKDSIVHAGWRHVLFIYAPLCVVSAIGWDSLINLLKLKVLKFTAVIAFSVGLLFPMQWMIRNHPNEYVYFNPLVGGIDGALGRYETDYFGNCLREASEWLINYHEKNNPYRPLVVRADGNIMSSYPYLVNRFKKWYFSLGYSQDFLQTDPYRFISFGPYVGGPPIWDYALVLSREWAGASLKDPQLWPPPGTIYEVKADHATLCAVVKNPLSKLR